jgi:hypothetical protein
MTPHHLPFATDFTTTSFFRNSIGVGRGMVMVMVMVRVRVRVRLASGRKRVNLLGRGYGEQDEFSR